MGEPPHAGDETAGPFGAVSPLARARLDEILEELLQRVGGMMDTQERLRGLLDAVVAIASDLSLDRVLEQIALAASRLADAEYVAMGVLGSGPDLRLREFITHGLTEGQRASIGDLPRGKGILGHIIDHPEPLRLSDLHDHWASFGFPANHPPMRSFLGVPVRIRDKVFGNLYLTEKRGGGQFTKEDEEIVIALAAAAGVAIENARLYEEGARREAWLEAAAEITTALLGPVDREEALQLVADRARSVASADLAFVMLRSDDGSLVIQVVSGVPAAEGVGRRVDVAGTLSGAALADGIMLVVEDVSREPTALHNIAAPASWPQPGPAMLLPLRTATGVDGLLTLIWAEENAQVFYDVDVQLPATFAEQAALALQVARAQESQARLAVFEDRDRIGRDLHDLVIQRLFAIGLSLENASNPVRSPDTAHRISEAVDDIDATINDIRRSIFALSVPTDSTALRKELLDVIATSKAALGFEPRFLTSGALDLAVPPAIRPHLMAVITEALSNAARHAGATSVTVDVTVGEDLVLKVSDDGLGFDPGAVQRMSGLRNMRDRAESLGGTCEVASEPGGGTTVAWRVPMSALSPEGSGP